MGIPMRTTRSQRPFVLLAATIAAILLVVHFSSWGIPMTETSLLKSASPSSSSSETGTGSRNAFVTFLGGLNEKHAGTEGRIDDAEDLYFVACRIMAYKFLHDPKTRTNTSIPFVVMVTEDVEKFKVERLKRDGAIVIKIDKIFSEWIIPKEERWADMLTKLRMFQLTQFDRIMYLDSDMLITRRMDGIFDDEAANFTYNVNDTALAKADEGPQPSSFVFAATTSQGGYKHPHPPRKGNALNGGCILFKPDNALFDHYMAVASIKDRFDPAYAEQNLLNYVHRRDGNMPWVQMNTDWNVNWPTMEDYNWGIASLHAKFWHADNDKDLRDLLLKGRWKMEGFWEGKEEEELEDLY
ncbi:MAG: hypothetical protein M4579_001097 [Chaenotheca gracillima]|nr:MAG: hypothetical protein M4579_001097 [Chaenotheca gracillima]